MTERPLASDNAVLWRKYAEALEAELAELRPQQTGTTFYGIPITVSPALAPGTAELRDVHGKVLGRVTGLSETLLEDFKECVVKDDWSLVAETATTVFHAVSRVRAKFWREPVEIRLGRPPEPVEEPEL